MQFSQNSLLATKQGHDAHHMLNIPTENGGVYHAHHKKLHVNATTIVGETDMHIVWKTSSLADSFLIELLSSVLVCLSVIFSWDWSDDNFALQFVPGIMLGLIMLCIKDEDYFFPDGSPMVTVMIWAMGGYFSWAQSFVRMLAHGIGFGISLWICSNAPIPSMTYHKQYSPGLYFGMEALTTCIEHIAIVYVVMPLLPANNSKGTRFLFPPVKPKSHPDTMAPSNSVVMHAALIFSVIHWVFWRLFSCEMNPSVLVLLTYLRTLQDKPGAAIDPHKSNHDLVLGTGTYDHWNYCMMGLWGQFVGLLVSLIYAYIFIPRSHKFKLLSPYENEAGKAAVSKTSIRSQNGNIMRKSSVPLYSNAAV